MSEPHDEFSLPQAAYRLRLPWHAAHKLVLRGELGPARQEAGRWRVSATGVDAYLARIAASEAPRRVVGHAVRGGVASAPPDTGAIDP